MSKARKHPASRARATVWTAERVDAVCRRHAEGAFLKHACAAEGGTYDGLIDAMARDPEITAKVHSAHAAGVDLYIARMNEAGAEVDSEGRKIRFGDWKREAWMLERFDREVFAPPTSKVESKAELTGKDGAPLVAMSLEDLAAAAARKASEE